MIPYPSPAPKTHQFTQTFTQWDGTENKAVIKARKVKHGWLGSIRIGTIQKTVTGVHPILEGCLSSTTRYLTLMKEHAVL